MTKFKKGDIVLVEATVDTDYIVDGNRMRLRVDYSDFFAPVDGMKMVRPVLQNGDMVWNRNLQRFGTVQSIHGERIWVEADSDTFPTWLFGDVERIEKQSLADLSVVGFNSETPPSFPGATDE